MPERNTEAMKNPMIMIDLETLGTGDNAAIVQIGAVMFDPWEGPTGVYTMSGMEFNKHILLNDPDIGVLDAPCAAWWIRQSDDARRRVFDPELERVYLANALMKLNLWVRNQAQVERADEIKYVWSHTSFDWRILTQAYARLCIDFPFKRYASKDYGTLKAMGRSLDIDEPLFVGVQHDAVDDAFHQVTYATTIIRKLGVFK